MVDIFPSFESMNYACVYIYVCMYMCMCTHTYIHIQFSKHHNLQQGLVHTLSLALENTEEIARRCLPRVFQSPPHPQAGNELQAQHV